MQLWQCQMCFQQNIEISQVLNSFPQCCVMKSWLDSLRECKLFMWKPVEFISFLLIWVLSIFMSISCDFLLGCSLNKFRPVSKADVKAIILKSQAQCPQASSLIAYLSFISHQQFCCLFFHPLYVLVLVLNAKSTVFMSISMFIILYARSCMTQINWDAAVWDRAIWHLRDDLH